MCQPNTRGRLAHTGLAGRGTAFEQRTSGQDSDVEVLADSRAFDSNIGEVCIRHAGAVHGVRSGKIKLSGRHGAGGNRLLEPLVAAEASDVRVLSSECDDAERHGVFIDSLHQDAGFESHADRASGAEGPWPHRFAHARQRGAARPRRFPQARPDRLTIHPASHAEPGPKRAT